MASNRGRSATYAPVPKPGDEYVAAGAALALAEHDVEGAVAWLSTHGPGDDADRRSRTYEMLREWAGAHPAEALRLIDSMLELDSNSELDCFPAPGLPTRLPNFQERYECLLEAVEAGNFPAGQRRSLLSSLYQNFRHRVPEAAQQAS